MEPAYKVIELDSWKRKPYFDFYTTFDQPFFGIDSEIKCTNAVSFCKEKGYSFFNYYMFCAFTALNEIEEFRVRIVDGEPRLYDVIHVGTTIGRPDETFGFAYSPYSKNFEIFTQSFKEEIQSVNESTGLRFSKDTARVDLMHCSSIPWISFTGIKHASNSDFKDSIPKLTFGKYYEKNNELVLPISIHAHHGIMDGIHVAKFFSKLEEYLQSGTEKLA